MMDKDVVSLVEALKMKLDNICTDFEKYVGGARYYALKEEEIDGEVVRTNFESPKMWYDSIENARELINIAEQYLNENKAG